MINSSQDLMQICTELCKEKVLSDKTLQEFSSLLDTTVIDNEIGCKILNIFDEIHRINCKSWMILMYIKCYKSIPQIFNYWQPLLEVKNLPISVLIECLEDAMSNSVTSWFSSHYLLTTDLKRRDSSSLSEWFTEHNGQLRVVEMLKLNNDLTSCVNMLRLIKLQGFEFDYNFEVPRILNFINSFNPKFTNLYQIFEIKCKDIQELNHKPPSLVFIQIIKNVLIVWIDSTASWILNLNNLKEYSSYKLKLKLVFKKLKTDPFNTVNYRLNSFTMEVEMKNQNHVSSFINKLRAASILKPKKISICLLDYTDLGDVDTNLMGSKPILPPLPSLTQPEKPYNPESEDYEARVSMVSMEPGESGESREPREKNKIKINDETELLRNLEKLGREKLDGNKRYWEDVSPSKEDSSFPSPHKSAIEPHTPIIKRLRSKSLDIEKQSDSDLTLKFASTEKANIQIPASFGSVETPKQLQVLKNFPEPVQEEAKLGPSLETDLGLNVSGPIEQGTNNSIYSPKYVLSSLDSKYDSIYDNLNSFNTDLIQRMKNFETQIIDKRNELNTQLNNSFDRLIDEHSNNLNKLNKFIEMKKKEIFKIEFD